MRKFLFFCLISYCKKKIQLCFSVICLCVCVYIYKDDFTKKASNGVAFATYKLEALDTLQRLAEKLSLEVPAFRFESRLDGFNLCQILHNLSIST